MTKYFCSTVVALLCAVHPEGARSTELQPVDDCFIRPFDTVEVATPVAGIVVEVATRRGDLVAPDQVIARLDTRIEELAIKRARAQTSDRSAINARRARLDFLEAQMARTQELATSNTVSAAVLEEAVQEAEVARQELSEARFALEIAEIELERAIVARDQKILRSPISGIVVERSMSPGEFLESEAQVASIARIDTLKVEAFVPISYFNDLEIGQTVQIVPEDPIGGVFAARITAIDRVFDASSATFGFEAEIENPNLALPAGIRCEIQFF